MDVALVIRQRLDELDLDQRDLADAAGVTESYVSQLLTHKKAPQDPKRTDVYDRMNRFLKLPHGEVESVRAISERESFGELERLVAQTLLNVLHLGSDVLHVTPKQRARLDATIASWGWDPGTFALTVSLANGEQKRFEYGERMNGGQEKGLVEFLRDPLLSGTATEEELAFLKSLRFKERRPTALYYYRELQNLRDPLHFRA